MRAFLFLVVCLCCASPVMAQTNPVPVNQPLSASWDANAPADNVTAYRCYVDKVKIGSDIPATTARVCTVPAQTAGQHVFELGAVNAFGEGPHASLTFTAGSAPSAPTNLKIVVQIAVQPSGEVTLLAASVAKE